MVVGARRVYVAEDTPEDSLLTGAVLKSIPDLEVQFFGDGLELFRAAQKSLPDLLLLDIILPRLAGLAVARLVKFHEDTWQVPVLVVSSITDPDIRERAAAMGADAFVPKPVEPDELRSTVLRLLATALERPRA